jgi:nucleotide-binding universal stress UspA family protein
MTVAAGTHTVTVNPRSEAGYVQQGGGGSRRPGRWTRRAHHAAVRVVAVAPREGIPPTSVAPTDWTTETLDAMQIEPSRLAGIPGATSEVVFGDLVEELTRFSESVDLLAIGSRSHGPLGRLIDGNVSHALLRRSHCPLLVLPRGLREPTPAAPDVPSRDLRAPGALAP